LHWETFSHAALRDFSNAFQTFEQAVSYLRRDFPADSIDGMRDRWLPTLHQDRGYLHFLLGDLSASIEHYLKAYQTTPDSQPSEQIQFLIDVGILHLRTQDYASARQYFDQAEHLLQSESVPPEERRALQARTYQMRADLQLSTSEYSRKKVERSRTLFQQAHALADSGTERHARISLLLSETQGYLGNFETAYRLNETGRQYARTHDNVRLQTFSLLKLGVLHVQTKRWTRADSTLSRALILSEKLGDLDYQRRILRTLGRLHEMQRNWGKAEKYYRRGIGVIEEYRTSLTASQWSMTAFAEWRNVHRGLVRTLLAQNRPREAFVALDNARARHLRDLRTQARVAEQLPPTARLRLDSLSRALTTVRNQLSTDARPDTQTTQLRNREAQLMAARQQLLQLDSRSARPSLDSIAATLRQQDRALVAYFVDDPWPVYDRSPRSAAFVLTPDTLRTVPLPGLTQDSVRTLTKSVSPLFSARGKPDRVNAFHFDLRPLHRLYNTIYAPVSSHLPEDRPVTIIPDGALFHLPFSMLVTSMPGGRFAPSKARFLVHDRATSLELAPSLVTAPDTSATDWTSYEPQLAAYGVSTFDTLETVPSALRTALPEAVQDSAVRLPPLPGVERELDALKHSVPDARLALNENATERSFCRDARRAGILHVASHAFVNASSPLQNAILLRPDDTAPGAEADTSGSDGVLFLHELQGQQTRIPLVVLSGCSTAEGTLRGGEGMEGLQYAFRAMGAQSTVSTLWPVADEASVELMEGFYHYLQNGHPKDVALQKAQLDYLDAHPQKASPFFWAPPVLYGSPAALPLDSKAFLPLWAWGLLFMIGLLVGASLFVWGRGLPNWDRFRGRSS